MARDPFKRTPFWRPAEDERRALLGHLLAELPPGHLLFGRRDTLTVEARDTDGDRLVVTSAEPTVPAAIVTMTWSGRPPMAPFLPVCEPYATLDALIAAHSEESAE